uniref:WASP family protein member n=1 Tax=Rhabditophanes sp. KR3021 TaxID=114890 RepID=A0AC35UFI3_9BILA
MVEETQDMTSLIKQVNDTLEKYDKILINTGSQLCQLQTSMTNQIALVHTSMLTLNDVAKKEIEVDLAIKVTSRFSKTHSLKAPDHFRKQDMPRPFPSTYDFANSGLTLARCSIKENTSIYHYIKNKEAQAEFKRKFQRYCNNLPPLPEKTENVGAKEYELRNNLAKQMQTPSLLPPQQLLQQQPLQSTITYQPTQGQLMMERRAQAAKPRFPEDIHQQQRFNQHQQQLHQLQQDAGHHFPHPQQPPNNFQHGGYPSHHYTQQHLPPHQQQHHQFNPYKQANNFDQGHPSYFGHPQNMGGFPRAGDPNLGRGPPQYRPYPQPQHPTYPNSQTTTPSYPNQISFNETTSSGNNSSFEQQPSSQAPTPTNPHNYPLPQPTEPPPHHQNEPPELNIITPDERQALKGTYEDSNSLSYLQTTLSFALDPNVKWTRGKDYIYEDSSDEGQSEEDEDDSSSEDGSVDLIEARDSSNGYLMKRKVRDVRREMFDEEEEVEGENPLEVMFKQFKPFPDLEEIEDEGGKEEGEVTDKSPESFVVSPALNSDQEHEEDQETEGLHDDYMDDLFY